MPASRTRLIPTALTRWIRCRAFLGADINAEILVANPWEPHLLLADAYQKGRVFLAGDAAHQYIPTGGYGMNTGIGDAVALGWILAATLNGWGGSGLLAAYEAERRPIGGINRGWSGRHTGVRIAIMEAYQAYPNAATDAAERTNLATAIAALGNLENEAWGVEFAYRYDASPLIAPMLAKEGGLPPLDDPAVIPAAAWPGMRAPSFILPDGQALFDLFDPSGFTLLRFNPDIDTSAMQQTGVPVTQIDVVLDTARGVYGADWRWSGQMATWRGVVMPLALGRLRSRPGRRRSHLRLTLEADERFVQSGKKARAVFVLEGRWPADLFAYSTRPQIRHDGSGCNSSADRILCKSFTIRCQHNRFDLHTPFS